MLQVEKFNVRIVNTGDKYGLNDCLVNRKEQMIEFYDWRKVLPQSASGAPGQFNAEYLSSFGDVARLLTGNKDNNPIIHHNGTSGALVTIPGHAAIGVIIPWRVDAEFLPHPGVPAWAK